ncbi:VWA domain-containing protein [Snuella sedimenti]|uniref:VWA domain-containing protein n=1 Tax=Snuella sedimenti TaxID=2798802 RepID=A0A8J7II38_9FLAO|nr:VWA domain-containing protein [Snuella sedimenti]MBJ6368671.1 VWA domain-containing protein [Snuella sedimenti]
MQTETLLYVILAGIIALLLALFQYKSKRKSMSKLDMLFSFLRFITIFSVLLLLINPKFKHTTQVIEKPNLVIALDNSNSIKYLKQDTEAKSLVNQLLKDQKLQNKFNIELYAFGESVNKLDTITFSEKQTNIDKVFKQFLQVYKQTTSPTILITDGNQTYGSDYLFTSSDYKQPIYPIILGDTVNYTDLKIQQLNVNKYAYLKNKFPVEAILVFNGNETINSRFVVTNGNTTVYSEPVRFSKNNNSKVINFTLPANRVGVGNYSATVLPINNEKNTVNNSKNFAVEIIDQKTKIAIVSDFPHPDLGALKRSIESNEQRVVTFLSPKEAIDRLEDFQLLILNQPNNKFKKVYDVLNEQNKNRLVIIGTKTDLNFLNTIGKDYTFEITNQTEDYQAELNLSYTPFIIDDIDFESFPPLKSNFGSVSFSVPYQSILNKRVNNVSINIPLLATFENDSKREAVLLGENIWQWRAQSFLNSKTFNPFDDFIGKLVQYLASNKRRDRLSLEYESFYTGSSKIEIKAQFFDKNYVFDTRETLNITVTDNHSSQEKQFPLILKNNHYVADLSNLPPSEYSFIISAVNENISKSGNFQILEYNVEQQFLNANVTKLEQLATNSKGKSFFISDTKDLVNEILNDDRFVAIQKVNKNVIPLVDWKYLLALIALSLSAEWFLRKYNGLI